MGQGEAFLLTLDNIEAANGLTQEVAQIQALQKSTAQGMGL